MQLIQFPKQQKTLFNMEYPKTTAEYLKDKIVCITDSSGVKHEGIVTESEPGRIIKIHYLVGGNVTFTEPKQIHSIIVRDGK